MDANKPSDPTLHVFQQDGAWHWGITIDRPTGFGMKVVAYSDEGFTTRQAGSSVIDSNAASVTAAMSA